MKQELLFEIGTEEIPAGYILPALNKMKHLLTQKLQELHLNFEALEGAATPRRLTVCIRGLDTAQQDRVEEILGPPKSAAYDAQGKPTKAAEGFAKSKGAELADITIVETSKGEYLMIKKAIEGEDSSTLLAKVLPEVVKEIPFPKSMRWGASRTAFARPIQWLLARFGEKTIDFHIDGAGTSANLTFGHRFMAPESFAVANYDQYVSALRDAHVLVDPQERRQAVLKEIHAAAESVGGKILPDEELVETVANLIESPHAVCGSFDDKFLALPQDALITSMREHQKYFAVLDDTGKLMPHFIAVNNTKVKDLQLAAEGHQRVLRARLEDAIFFFNEDRQIPLQKRAEALGGIVFQAKLGTMLEKSERIADLSENLAQMIDPPLAADAKQAASLCKADLLTEMVNEFPSLQGLMGRDYAQLNGESELVAQAIGEHYMPVRAGSALPESVCGAIVSLADRIDTIAGCFGIGQVPTGTTDPFGLRRLALGLIHILEKFQFTVSLAKLFDAALGLYNEKLTEPRPKALQEILEFVKGRFVNDQIAKGIPAGTIEAAVSVGFDDIADCLQRIWALNEIKAQPSFALLAGAFKRVMNITRDYNDTALDETLFTDNAEKKLFEAYKEVKGTAQPHIDQGAYLAALEVILQMKDPVDTFFDEVMVMTDDEGVRNNRLALLTNIAQLFLQIGDFSKMASA